MVKGCFIPWGVEAGQAEEQGQPKEGARDKVIALGRPPRAAFHELVARLAAARVENKALK